MALLKGRQLSPRLVAVVAVAVVGRPEIKSSATQNEIALNFSRLFPTGNSIEIHLYYTYYSIFFILYGGFTLLFHVILIGQGGGGAFVLSLFFVPFPLGVIHHEAGTWFSVRDGCGEGEAGMRKDS